MQSQGFWNIAPNEIKPHPSISKKHTLETQFRFAKSSAENGSEMYRLCHLFEAQGLLPFQLPQK